MANDKHSIAQTARAAKAEDKKIRDAATKFVANQKSNITQDSFQNFMHKMGVGADNPLSSASYGFNPITRIRTTLEWMHRGSWIAGMAVDIPADDMTREGVEIMGKMDPDDMERINERATNLNIWGQVRDTVAWSRLYGGAIAVMLIDGQLPYTPLRMESIGKDMFKGLLVLDRWMVEAQLNDLVTEYGPNLGLPKYYKVTSNAPALPNQRIHYSRILRLEGVRLPHWQRVMENLWGISVLERVYDRMISFDSATTGAAQLVYKSYLRTLKIKDLKTIVAAGGDFMNGVAKYADMMRRFQSIEGITLLDAEDDYGEHGSTAFTGLSDALAQFGQQLSGALQIPLVRLFGQSPTGFSTGDSDLRNYYDGIKQAQERDLLVPLTRIYRAITQSEGIEVPPGFSIKFRSLWQLSDTDKASIASNVTSAIISAEQAGIVDRATALKELRQSSDTTGVWSNISDDDIEQAEGELPPSGEEAIAGIGKPEVEEPETLGLKTNTPKEPSSQGSEQ